ncbi:MAG: hypothetical protein ABJA76_21580 [Mucilaginibacter sp.]
MSDEQSIKCCTYGAKMIGGFVFYRPVAPTAQSLLAIIDEGTP